MCFEQGGLRDFVNLRRLELCRVLLKSSASLDKTRIHEGRLYGVLSGCEPASLAPLLHCISIASFDNTVDSTTSEQTR